MSEKLKCGPLYGVSPSRLCFKEPALIICVTAASTERLAQKHPPTPEGLVRSSGENINKGKKTVGNMEYMRTPSQTT